MARVDHGANMDVQPRAGREATARPSGAHMVPASEHKAASATVVARHPTTAGNAHG
jgi:hypothetical protein